MGCFQYNYVSTAYSLSIDESLGLEASPCIFLPGLIPTLSRFQGLHFHTVYIESPPRLPRPGDGRTNDAVHSEPNLNAPTSHSKLPEFHPLPAYMGPTFTALCGLWSIAHDLTREYYDDEDVTTPILKARLETAEGFFHRLLAWADELPLGLVRGDQTTHHATLAQ